MFYEPMVNPFRDMMKDVEAKGLTGEDVDQMRAQLTFMEQLAQQVDDIATYTGKLAQENTFQKFSDAYSRALSSAAKASAKGQSDEEMMASTMGAYEQAAQTYRSGDAGETGALLLPFMEQILAIGRSGLSFPVFLRTLEERGLNRVLDGAAPAVVDGSQRRSIESPVPVGGTKKVSGASATRALVKLQILPATVHGLSVIATCSALTLK